MPLLNNTIKHLAPVLTQLETQTQSPGNTQANTQHGENQKLENRSTGFSGLQSLPHQHKTGLMGNPLFLQCGTTPRLPHPTSIAFPTLTRASWQSSNFLPNNLALGRFTDLKKTQQNKQDKSALVQDVQAQGHTVNHLLVTRRPQDFMFSQAKYTDSGFCQGFVMSALQDDTVFKSNIDEAAVTQKAKTAQHSYEGAFRFSGTDPKSHLYQQNGFQLGQPKNFSQTSGLIQHIQTQVQQKLSGDNPLQDKIFFDVHLSGGGRVDHATGIAIEKQPNGTFNAAVIDADRGYRRTLNTTDLNGFFQDLEKQSSGEKTKGGHNRKFHSWQNRHIVAREVKAAGSK